MESCHETGRLARIDAALLSTCESLRAIHARSHATYSFVTHQARIGTSRATKLRRTYLLCGYGAPSLTQSLYGNLQTSSFYHCLLALSRTNVNSPSWHPWRRWNPRPIRVFPQWQEEHHGKPSSRVF